MFFGWQRTPGGGGEGIINRNFLGTEKMNPEIWRGGGISNLLRLVFPLQSCAGFWFIFPNPLSLFSHTNTEKREILVLRSTHYTYT